MLVKLKPVILVTYATGLVTTNLVSTLRKTISYVYYYTKEKQLYQLSITYKDKQQTTK